MPLVEYAKKNKKEFKESPKHPLINLFIHSFFFLYQFWALHPRGGGPPLGALLRLSPDDEDP